MQHNNNKPGSVFNLVCESHCLEYAVVLRQHPDNPDLLLMVPLSHTGSRGTTDILFQDKLWNPDYDRLLKTSPNLPGLMKWILEMMNNPVDESVIAYCGHTFWIESEKLTSVEENVASRNLRLHAEYMGDLQERNLKDLKMAIHILATGGDFSPFAIKLHDEGTAEYEDVIEDIEGAIRYIEAR